jgi:hypothetical protein
LHFEPPDSHADLNSFHRAARWLFSWLLLHAARTAGRSFFIFFFHFHSHKTKQQAAREEARLLAAFSPLVFTSRARPIGRRRLVYFVR